MATRANDRGFRPVRHLNGRLNPSPHMRTTVNEGSSGNNANSIFIGDVVYLNTSGALQSYTEAASGAETQLPLGVVANVFDANKRPFTFSQPTNGPFIPTSTEGYAMVYEDPGIIYAANCSTTARHDMVGSFCHVRVCAANTAAGRSGHGLDIDQSVTAGGHIFKMVGISPLDSTLESPPVSGAANNDIEVLLINSYWSNPFRAIETGSPASGSPAQE